VPDRLAQLQRPALHGDQLIFVQRAIPDRFLQRSPTPSTPPVRPPVAPGVKLTPLPEVDKAGADERRS